MASITKVAADCDASLADDWRPPQVKEAPDLAAPLPRLPWQEIDIFRPIWGLQVLAVVRSKGG